MKHEGFTLAEVLITLAIIGVVAALTIPTVVQRVEEMQYKSAYKKAYSDLTRIINQGVFESEIPPRKGSLTDQNIKNTEWNYVKSKFKVTKSCDKYHLYDCWVDADRVCTGSCNANLPAQTASRGFIDAQGRAWAEYSISRSIYLVDVNGSKAPNRFGKDRFHFELHGKDDLPVSWGYPVKVGPVHYVNDDYKSPTAWCNHPPCYYYSWLYGTKK